MIDCKNYRYQDSTGEEWCREGVDTSFCKHGEQCPFYEKCVNEDELEERHYPED